MPTEARERKKKKSERDVNWNKDGTSLQPQDEMVAILLNSTWNKNSHCDLKPEYP